MYSFIASSRRQLSGHLTALDQKWGTLALLIKQRKEQHLRGIEGIHMMVFRLRNLSYSNRLDDVFVCGYC